MPHFGLMDESRMSESEAALQRARLHLRGAKRRLRQGKLSAGIATLYDAVVSGMQWYVLSGVDRTTLALNNGDDLASGPKLHAALVKAKVLDSDFDFDGFNRLTEKALDHPIRSLDNEKIIEQIECLMTRLGVMPFDESSLPSEDPATF